MRLSFSRIKTWRQCPHAYELTYVRNLGKQESAAACQGAAVHEACARWEISGRTCPPHLAFEEEYAKAVSEAEKKQPREEWKVWGKRTVDEDITTRFENGSEQCRLAEQLLADSPPLEIVQSEPAVEVNFSLTLGWNTIVGAIDRIDHDRKGTPRVVDLKTGVREHTPLQLGIYRLAARKCLGIETDFGAFIYLKDGKIETHGLRRFTEDYLAEQADQTAAGIQTGLFQPSPGSHCHTCSVRQHCKELGRV